MEEGFIADPGKMGSNLNDRKPSGEIKTDDSVNYEEMDLDLERIFTTKKQDEQAGRPDSNNERPKNQNIIKLQPEGQEKKPDEKQAPKENKNDINKPMKDMPKTEKSKGALDDISYQDKKIIEDKIQTNSTSIKEIEERLDSISEDVDDLVSLYEIVSVEMNPFVGLSKITRKRLDALEHMDKGFEELKTRIEDLERNPRTVVQEAELGKVAQKALEEPSTNIVQSGIDKIIDDAVRYVLNEKEIDSIIGKFVEDLKINIGMNNNKEGK